MMDHEFLGSSNVRSASWSEGELRINYIRGGAYVYHLVPKEVFDRLMTAPSAGAFVNENVKPLFRCTQLQLPAAALAAAQGLT